ncbi:crossover junction endodeoxyribonuclease RuvC [bacterium (Candidatus Gribaldobacteria) CG07_land_8_20_14_0_80_33_18]|uniref:Crossover junction endodeoxyribonuclease RuvC n=1 Tax=bacterium (Candidatus Gribaldobacteria) CG07_land_8_20_14_0_80_33_18 TaxID=2014272 RepID=A0A2M6Z1Z1_9BACT|nr:MAG: crossover junction endodeoxyribonuclease RuvC [bacterium (Candidatus Gribaldobacteria) CG10_big_fil_rev_8_21_14_0_10_33_41]PIU46393.1 MAG: crossover junction endodeoxyribonuclease RuvC [bacterium (Candidatus Gribaldobacteria) CG07_land_8_20_14_0_80_33_18]PJA01020.1 MAG: crossover junction endodeoxyribonuclease RuvC [bacterium (Candidatus Gribaldobacteria) CG_4_10_14_0_2_um_filter_33_15]PJB08542.1 MAG: crossover junction endodeoxyribonuclease RuvC [bacterium (Candidatus Gribaldobacteria) 
MIIIGIDPGTAITGYGVIKVKNQKSKAKDKLKCLEYGVIKTSSSSLIEERLKKIYFELSKLIKKYKPKTLIIERLYFFKNLKTAIPVSQAQGVILLLAAKKKIKIFYFTPLEVKMGISGYGRATKYQVQRMVKEILNLKKIPKPDDAADALALAICYTFSKR